MNRRSFFRFLAATPVAVVAALKAKRVPSFESIWDAIDGATTADKTKGLLWTAQYLDPPELRTSLTDRWAQTVNESTAEAFGEERVWDYQKVDALFERFKATGKI